MGESTLTLKAAEKRAIRRALIMTAGNRIKAAKILETSEANLQNKITEYKKQYDHFFVNEIYKESRKKTDFTAVENEET